MKSTVAEVARDIKDAVGEMIEQGAQSVTAPQLTPQQIQQKQQQDQKDLAKVRGDIEWLRRIDEQQKGVREQNKQKEMQRLQNQQQEKQQGTQKVQIQSAKKQQVISETVLRTQAERKVGKGVGG